MRIETAEFVKSAMQPAQYPQGIFPQIAFAGRSNVGKSSLLNSLVNKKNLAKTSSTPGRTRTINFFVINKKTYFVDLPGYGYAKVPKEMKENWGKSIEAYFKNNQNINLVVLILDVRRTPSELDLQLYHWLLFYNIPHVFVITKIDKVTKNQLNTQKKEIVKVLNENSNSDEKNIILYSSKTGEGKKELLKAISDAIKK